ncbi:TIR domain-containing protein [Burkholderia gladioli]|uniref:TIR domain-containing protein n=1 Tax=Burkholderia gladioli TaxID=28095 RepID=UPI0016415F0F|nr:TIR domain-containing protein [Burkholderia gladioli]
MAYLTEDEVLQRAVRTTRSLYKSAHKILIEAAASEDDTFDVFLSHSSAEPEDILLGVKGLLEDRGLNVYVDKYSDPQLSPDEVTRETAEILRGRMKQSNTLLYVHSRHSKKSRWMPWELGFFDGLKGAVGILPVTQKQEATFKGEEYLNLYPYVDVASAEGETRKSLWINKSATVYARLDLWATGKAQIRLRK